jgi:hypothetical protein
MPKSWEARRQGNPHRYRSRVFSLGDRKLAKKKPTGINAVGLNPSFGRVEETRKIMPTHRAGRKSLFPIINILFMNNSFGSKTPA